MAWVKIQVAGNDVKVEEGEQNARASASSSSKSASKSVDASTGTSPGSDTRNLANSTPSELKPDEVQIEELPEDEDNDDPSKQLNIISQDELDAIDAVPLQGASLGTKLDTIVKHVKLLRQRHQRAIEQYDIAMAARNKEGHPGNSVMEAPPTEAKVLIYSAWQYACEVLAEAFSRERIKHVRLEGYGKKESAVLEFTGNPNCSVFILHAKSQAAGLVRLEHGNLRRGKSAADV